jgi:uncharacterized Ntn-hydrolase superfamily protein
MPYPSTFSIVAFDSQTQEWGIAVASKFPAVGAVVPWARAGAGAVATQSFANTSYGPNGLDLMANGLSASETLARLLENDPGREQRQVGLVDAQGGAATFTGEECHNWAGGVTGDGFAIQGNILAGAGVVESMKAKFAEMQGDLAARLHAALLAGDRAGGDRRGRQSAAILVVQVKGGYGGFNDRKIDYRVDDHADPVIRLGELLHLHQLYFDKSPEADVIKLNTGQIATLQKIMQRLGFFKGTLDGQLSEETRRAFTEFIGNENFEERCNPEEGLIDRPVLEYLLKKFSQE